jgi:hypothetical protein
MIYLWSVLDPIDSTNEFIILNAINPFIDHIMILTNHIENTFNHPKITWIQHSQPSLFKSFFNFMNYETNINIIIRPGIVLEYKPIHIPKINEIFVSTRHYLHNQFFFTFCPMFISLSDYWIFNQFININPKYDIFDLKIGHFNYHLYQHGFQIKNISFDQPIWYIHTNCFYSQPQFSLFPKKQTSLLLKPVSINDETTYLIGEQ